MRKKRTLQHCYGVAVESMPHEDLDSKRCYDAIAGQPAVLSERPIAAGPTHDRARIGQHADSAPSLLLFQAKDTPRLVEASKRSAPQ